MTPKKVQIAACDGDRLANRIYEFTGHCLGKAAAEFAAVTGPRGIYPLPEESPKAGDLLLKPMREAFLESALFLYKDRVRFPSLEASRCRRRDSRGRLPAFKHVMIRKQHYSMKINKFINLPVNLALCCARLCHCRPPATPFGGRDWSHRGSFPTTGSAYSSTGVYTACSGQGNGT